MSGRAGRDFRLARVSLIDRAARVDDELTRRAQVAGAGQDRRDRVQYLADLEAETARSLARSPHWRAGRPLADHREHCDCPPSLAGCVERQSWPRSAELPRGDFPLKGRWAR